MAQRATIHTESLEEALASPLDIEALDLELAEPELPDGIYKLRNLSRLKVRGGTLTKVSPRLVELKALRHLWLDKQPKLDLADFPVLPKLEWLGLRNCKLRALPPAIFACRELRDLSLGMNPLAVVPPEIGALRKLTALYLWGCELAAIPPELGKLSALRLLEIEKNRLTDLPPELAGLKQLTRLHLEKNAFTALPDVVCKLTTLEHLEAYDNQITALPDELTQLTQLETLRLEHNRIARFPADLSPLTKLTTFYVSLGITKPALRKQVTQLPPRAFIMSFEDGDLARNGRWAGAPARSSADIAADSDKPGVPGRPAKKTRAAGAEEHVFRIETRCAGLAFAAGGIAGVSYEALHMFDLATGKPRFRRLGDHRGLVASHDGEHLLACTDSAALFDARANRKLGTIRDTERAYYALPSRDGSMLLVYIGNELRCLDARTHDVLHVIHTTRATFAEVSPDNQRIMYGNDKMVHVWDRAKGAERFRTRVCRFGVSDGWFSPDGSHAIVLTTEAIVRLDLAVKKPKPVEIMKVSSPAFAVTPDGLRAVVGGPEMRVVDLARGEAIATLGRHENVGPVDHIAVSPDGTRAASSGCDQTVRVWRLPA